MNVFAGQPNGGAIQKRRPKDDRDRISRTSRNGSSGWGARIVGLHRVAVTAENSLEHRLCRPGFDRYAVADVHPFHHVQETDLAEL